MRLLILLLLVSCAKFKVNDCVKDEFYVYRITHDEGNFYTLYNKYVRIMSNKYDIEKRFTKVSCDLMGKEFE